MNRNPNEVHEYATYPSICRSMNVYPNDLSISPLFILLNLNELIKTLNVPEYHGTYLRCHLCGAFLSPYCIIQERPYGWKCAICNSMNPLPLPPSDSIHTPISLIEQTPLHSNVLYDYVSSQNHVIISPLRPLQILAIQNSLIPFLEPILNLITLDSELYYYCLIIFDSQISIYNYKSKRWEVMAEIASHNSILINCSTDYTRYFEKSQTFLHLIHKLPHFTTSSLLKNQSCNLESLFIFVQHLINSLPSHPLLDNSFKIQGLGVHSDHFEFEHPLKLNILISGPVINIGSFFYSYPISILHFGQYFSDLFSLREIQSHHQNSVLHIDQNQNSSYIATQIFNLLHNTFLRGIRVQLRAPNSFEIHTPSEFNSGSRKKFNIRDEKFYQLNRTVYGSSKLVLFIQFEISFIDIQNRVIHRFFNLKIPMATDPRISPRNVFPNPIEHIITAASYLIQVLKYESIGSTALKMRSLITKFSYEFPIPHNILWPIFIYNLLESPLFAFDNFSSSGINSNLYGKLDFLTDAHPALSFLSFLSLDYSGEQIIPPYLFPKSGLRTNEIKSYARITSDAIYELNGYDGSAQAMLQQSRLENLQLPLIKVDIIQPLNSSDELEQWVKDWEISQFGHLEGKRNKIYNRK